MDKMDESNQRFQSWLNGTLEKEDSAPAKGAEPAVTAKGDGETRLRPRRLRPRWQTPSLLRRKHKVVSMNEFLALTGDSTGF